MRNLDIEFQNNATTPVEAVVKLNRFVFGWGHNIAFENTLTAHQHGRALVAVFLESRLTEIQLRLQTFIDQMDKPVTFKVIDGTSGDLSLLHVDFDALLSWEDDQSRELNCKRDRRFWTALTIAIALASTPVVLLKAN